MRILWERCELFSSCWRLNSTFIQCGHYLPSVKIILNRNLCILSVILKLSSALLSILIDFNWSADENKRKSGLTQMAECTSESLIHFYLSLVVIFWVNLTEVIKQLLLRVTSYLHTDMEIGHLICHLIVITILIHCS